MRHPLLYLSFQCIEAGVHLLMHWGLIVVGICQEFKQGTTGSCLPTDAFILKSILHYGNRMYIHGYHGSSVTFLKGQYPLLMFM